MTQPCANEMRAGTSVPKINAAKNTASLPEIKLNGRIRVPFPAGEVSQSIVKAGDKDNNS